MRPDILLTVLGLLFFTGPLDAQIPGGPTQSLLTQVDIPFEYYNDFMVIKLTLNRTFPLRFIFDTGAENTILTKRQITDIMQTEYQREFRVMGADMTKELIAYLATGLTIQIENLVLYNQPLLVLEEDYFGFEEFTGTNIHGILGANVFRHFIVKINYQRRMITLFKPDYFTGPPKGYLTLPIEVHRSKPYIRANTYLPNQDSMNLKLLVDTGAGLALLLYTNTHPDLRLPQQVIPGNIGMGLGGYLEGFQGRTDYLDLDPSLRLSDLPVSFQEITTTMDTSFLNGRNGIIGNQTLRRFSLIIDYFREEIHLSPNRYYRQKFKFDRSGLSVVAGGPRLNTYAVQYVLPGSPADRAGVQKGDEIKGINLLPRGLIELSSINKRLRRPVGSLVRLKLKRGTESLKVRFHLEELLPTSSSIDAKDQ